MDKMTDTHTDNIMTEFECATKLWNTGTLSGKTANRRDETFNPDRV